MCTWMLFIMFLLMYRFGFFVFMLLCMYVLACLFLCVFLMFMCTIVEVFSVPTVDRMFTTTQLSDHVQDHMTSRLHQPQKGWRSAVTSPYQS